jgi:hypothetical protein
MLFLICIAAFYVGYLLSFASPQARQIFKEIQDQIITLVRYSNVNKYL